MSVREKHKALPSLLIDREIGVTQQSVEYIDLGSLVLWTENPRDPIRSDASNQDIVDRALEDAHEKWLLKKLAKEMGTVYDQSELPTVVMHQDVPVVYDGNRRVILGLLAKKLVEGWQSLDFLLPDYPDSLPCNFCEKQLALQHVYRKHYDSGSWAPLERDIFLNRHLGEPKTSFLIFEEETGLISRKPTLNAGFVKKEVLTDERLGRLGFSLSDGSLKSRHSPDDAANIIADLVKKIEEKSLSTRNNRGDVYGVLDPVNQDVVDRDSKNDFSLLKLPGVPQTEVHGRKKKSTKKKAGKKKRSARSRAGISHSFFGGVLYLNSGEVNDLYRDLDDLYAYFERNRGRLSGKFPAMVRMGLRLLVDTAANGRIEDYVDRNFDTAKKQLSSDEKTTLRTQYVTKGSIVQLLHIGAHNYSAAANLPQTLALSLIVGALLEVTHGKGDKG